VALISIMFGFSICAAILMFSRSLATLGREIRFRADQQAEIGAANHFLEVVRRGQVLLHPDEIGLPLGRRDPHLLRQDAAHLREDAGLGFVAVGDERDHQPAGQAKAPGDAEGQPSARPHLVESDPDLVVESVHRRCCP
jgi:hypothetical protein